MRTTVRLDDALFTAVKRYAGEHRTTVTAVLEEALREKLARAQAVSRADDSPPLPTFAGRGPLPGVDLHDGSSLLDLMDHADA
jgi:hypothetical protein